MTLRLPPLEGPPTRLTLAPLDRPGALRLEALTLKASDGRVLWQWDGQLAGLSPNGLEVLPEDQGALLVSLGAEGQLTLPLDGAQLAALGDGGDLDCRLHLLAPEALIGHLLARLDEGRRESEGLREAIAAMEASSSWRLTKPLRQAKTLLGKS